MQTTQILVGKGIYRQSYRLQAFHNEFEFAPTLKEILFFNKPRNLKFGGEKISFQLLTVIPAQGDLPLASVDQLWISIKYHI